MLSGPKVIVKTSLQFFRVEITFEVGANEELEVIHIELQRHKRIYRYDTTIIYMANFGLPRRGNAPVSQQQNKAGFDK